MTRILTIAILAGSLAIAGQCLAQAAGGPAAAEAAEPSVESMVEALRMKPRTRSLGARPGAPVARQEGRLQLSVNFEFNSAELTPQARALLGKLAAAMAAPELRGLEYRIEGHTDATGGGAYNLRLSQRRAESVRAFLAQSPGIEAGGLQALGMGSAKLADPANPASGVNRRVVVVSLEPLPGTASAPPAASAATASPPAKGPAAAAAKSEGAGTVEQLRGEVKVSRGQSRLAVAAGDRVREGDVLTSSAGGTALVRLDDGAKLLLRAESALRIVRLKLTGDTSTWSQAFELVVGAFRYVTGALGGNRPEAVAISTPYATVGIRGTDIDLVNEERAVGDLEAGTYVRVNAGAVTVGGVDGTKLSLARSEEGFAGAKKPRTRGGKPVPAAVKLTAPAPVFGRGDFDDLIDPR